MQQHACDAELIEYLDGEIGYLGRWRLQVHLVRCWECRGRKRELEEHAHRIALALRMDRFPDPDRVANARERFERRLRTVTPLAGSFRKTIPWQLKLGSCGAVAILAAAPFWISSGTRVQPPPVPALAPVAVSRPPFRQKLPNSRRSGPDPDARRLRDCRTARLSHCSRPMFISGFTASGPVWGSRS
jgi:anti-sigma factor RsiW